MNGRGSILSGFPLRHYNAARRLYWDWRVAAICRKMGIELGRNASCYGVPVFSMEPGSRIAIGDSVVLCSVSEMTALGVNHPVVMRTLTPEAEIIIGDNCGMSGVSVCAACSVRIGEGTLLGANAAVFDTDFHPLKAAGRRWNSNWRDIGTQPVRIGRNVFIGAGAMVCKGVAIGENSVVAAGSVVVKDVPANTIAGGNPARIIGGVPS